MSDRARGRGQKQLRSLRDASAARLHRYELLHFAHDLRNLVLPILQSAELLLESGSLAAQQENYAKTIVRQVDRTARLIEDILFLANESGCHYPVDMQRVVKEVVERVKEDTGVGVQCLFLVGNPVFVAGSESRLWRAVHNLVLNGAEAAGDRGHVLVHVSFDEIPDTLRIEIKDSGQGIPDDIRDGMFLPSFSTKTSHVGLGLSFVKEVIEEYQGNVSLDSESGQGATVIIRLPLLSA